MASTPSASLQYDTDIFTNYVPDLKNPTGPPQVIQSYTINIHCFDAKGVPVTGGSLLIQASASTIVNLNGKTVMLTVNPSRYALDITGEIGLIVPSTGLQSPSYTFSYLKDQSGTSLNLPITTIDPSRKALAAFENITTGAQLKSLPGRAGTTLYANTSPPSDSDLNTAAKAFQDLSQAAKTLPLTSTDVQNALDAVAKAPLPNDGWPSNNIQLPDNALTDPQGALNSAAAQAAHNAAEQTRQLQMNLLKNLKIGSTQVKAGAVTTPAPPHIGKGIPLAEHTQVKSASIGSFFSNIGHDIKNEGDKGVDWATNTEKGIEGTLQRTTDNVEHKVKSAGDPSGWIINAAKTSWAYSVKFADQVWNIVIGKMDDIGKAFDKVWDVIKLGWKELETWVGFLFDWDHIVAAQKVIQSCLTSTIDLITAEAKEGGARFKNALKDIANDLKISSAPTPNTKASDVSNKPTVGTHSNQSAPDKWLSHQSKHGGIFSVQSSTPLPSGSSSAPTDNTNKLESTVDQIEPFFTKAADDIASQFGSSLDFRISDALAKIGDTLLKMMTDAYNTFTDVLMDAIHELVDLLKQIGNAIISVPIISWIYRQITKEELTMFSFISLCVAIPTCFMYRLCKGDSRYIGKAFTVADLQKPIAGPQPSRKVTVSAAQVKLGGIAPVISVKKGDDTQDNNQTQVTTQAEGESPDFWYSCAAASVATVKMAVAGVLSFTRAFYMESLASGPGVVVVSLLNIIAGGFLTYIATTSSGLPAQRLRFSVPAVLMFGAVVNIGIVVYRAIDTNVFGRKCAKAVHVINMVVSTANFIQSTVIFTAEMDSTQASWPKRDEQASVAQEFANVFAWFGDLAGAWADLCWENADELSNDAPSGNRVTQAPPVDTAWVSAYAPVQQPTSSQSAARKSMGQKLDVVKLIFILGNMASLWTKAGLTATHKTDFAVIVI